MHNIVWLLGILISAVGAGFVFKPTLMKRMISFFMKGKLLYIPCVMKVILGLIFIAFCGYCNRSLVILVIGVITAAGGAVGMIVPLNKLKAYCQWWINRPTVMFRIWAVIAILLGILIMYAGAPKVTIR